jgi:hypothetical protein
VRLPACAIATAFALTSATAGADESTAGRCIADAKRGQEQRDRGELLASRASFVACGDATCPAVVQRECVRWLAEVDERLPGIVISVQDDEGRDVVGARVRVDGQERTDARSGRELRIDPGPHRIEAMHEAGRTVSSEVIVRERERGRAVRLVVPLARPASAAASSAARSSADDRRSSVPLASWILGGTAVVAGAGFGYFWATGVDDVHELRRTCAPACSDDAVDGAARSITIARVSLGIAAAAALAAVVVYFVDSRSAKTNAAGRDLTIRF